MKKITLILLDGYDQVLSVTAIGTEIISVTSSGNVATTTNVTTKVYEIDDGRVYVLPDRKECENNE